jgi:hypothetical protein
VTLLIVAECAWVGGDGSFEGNRGAQTGVFELDIRILNPPYIDVCKALIAETGLEVRNVEKRINAV